MPDFLLPDLGEGLDEAEIIDWRVQVGDHVTVDQVIAEVETAKAAVEVPVPFAGVVANATQSAGTICRLFHCPPCKYKYPIFARSFANRWLSPHP